MAEIVLPPSAWPASEVARVVVAKESGGQPHQPIDHGELQRRRHARVQPRDGNGARDLEQRARTGGDDQRDTDGDEPRTIGTRDDVVEEIAGEQRQDQPEERAE